MLDILQHRRGIGDAGQHVVAQSLDHLAGRLPRLLAAFQQAATIASTSRSIRPGAAPRPTSSTIRFIACRPGARGLGASAPVSPLSVILIRAVGR